MAKGFAYIDSNGDIDVATVSATERAAKVNAIVTISHYKIIPLANWSDDDINLTFIDVTANSGHIIAVEIFGE